MRQPSTASAPGSSSRAPGPSATETVARPEPGLARGAWEAPPWVFWTLLGAVAVFATLYLLFRLGVLRIRSRGPGVPPKAGAENRGPGVPPKAGAENRGAGR